MELSRSRKTPFVLLSIFFISLMVGFLMGASGAQADEMRFIQIEARNKEDRTAITHAGVSIEAIRSDSVWGFAHEAAMERVRNAGFRIIGNYDLERGRGGHENLYGFPAEDAAFHTYSQAQDFLRDLAKRNPDIARMTSIGKTWEKRDLWALHINTSPDALNSGSSGKPGMVYMGNHHAREHLSAEVPLLLAKYLLENRNDPKISRLLDGRDIWIMPMINPDGAEFDIATGRYQYWRKNRRPNSDGSFGVDLNRNYGYKWGTGGSDTDTRSDVYMGPSAFSEPETQAVKTFIEGHPNFKMLLTFHTFSELILYPWGHTYSEIDNSKDLAIYKKMAQTMAGWNHYTAEQSSELYITSGDTTDWSYGEHGIFSFTFELSPKGWGVMSDGGFYPGAKIIDRVFQDNIKPCLYMLEAAGDPSAVLDNHPSGFLKNYVEKRDPVPTSSF